MLKVARYFAMIALIASVSGCGEKVEVLTPAVQAQMMDDLKAGNLVLDCGEKCSFAWAMKVDSIHSLDLAERWPELAQSVMKIGYGQDLAYYYLGQAAQGLGYHEAAIKYYQWAYALAASQNTLLQCASLGSDYHDPCQGVNLVAAVPVLIDASKEAIARQQVATSGSPAPVKRVHHKKSAGTAEAAATPDAAATGPADWSLPPPPTK
jgi:hypothetical protein